MAENIDVNVNVNTKEANRAIDQLNNSITALLTVITGRQLQQFADGITNLRNKLSTLTPDLNTVNKQFEAITAIAINARTPLESTADLFFRIARVSDQLGISQKEAATITESLAKAMSASGLSAGEAAGPLLQLGQALQSGVFQGDELRSILEGLPVVAKALADELGVPIGQLRKLGADGQITADIFVKAMRRAKDSIDDAFGRTGTTIGQAFETLKTTTKIVFDEFDRRTGTSEALGNAIIYIAAQVYKLKENIDAIVGPLKVLFQILATLATFTLVGKVFGVLGAAVSTVAKTFATAIEKGAGLVKTLQVIGHYIGRALGLITVQAPKNTVIEGLAKSFGFLAKELAGVGIAIASTLGAIGAFLGIDKLFDMFKKGTDANKSMNEEIAEFKKQLEGSAGGLDDAANASQNLIAQQKELAKALAKTRLESNISLGSLDRQLEQVRERLSLENELLKLSRLDNTLSQDGVELAKVQTEIDIERRNALQAINDQISKLSLEYSQLTVKDSFRGKELQQQIGVLKEQSAKTKEIYDKHEKGMIELTTQSQTLKKLDEDRQRTNDNIIKSIEDQLDRMSKLGDLIRDARDKLADVRFEGEQQGRTPLERQFASIQENARKAAQSAQRAFADMFSGLEMTPELTEELANGLDRIAGEYKKIADAQSANLEASRTWAAGWKDAFDQYMDNASNAAKKAGDVFSSITRNMESAIDKFVETGKFSFSDFARSIIQDMLKIELKAAASKILSGIFGSAGSFLGSLFGFAGGGNPPVNKPSIVGENGPELFVPKTAGTVIPNQMLGGGAPVTNNYYTYNIDAIDSRSVAQFFAENRKTMLGTIQLAQKELPYFNK